MIQFLERDYESETVWVLKEDEDTRKEVENSLVYSK